MSKKTWIVTGTSTGFGKSLATYLAQQKDVNLVATARNTQKLSYLDQFDHGQIIKLTLDVTNENDVVSVINNTKSRFKTIDVLINNAGIGYFGTFEESNLADARSMFEVNVWGLVNMSRAVLKTMREQKSGTIVNFSSIGGLASFPTLSFYHGTKYAVEGISESLAEEVKDLNIKILLIEPSGFRTDWAGRSSKKVLPDIPDYQQFSKFIEDNENGAHHEPGDPNKAAQIIYDQVTNNPNLPLRLPLGKYASDTAIEKYEKNLNSFKELHNLSTSADSPEK
ncbi:SDR family NAD(P)-dependent oxidoreductase [Companilactobacillus kimchii]|uniref:Short chain dehydrogenase n=2 Tax=Companilactobacillus kimchii TaxID=2801452 RepID=A0ABR5NVS4_9LACO|nr:SDR family NAD(P)-dependent oxidoreductase [Companilactobacillus kimchii]KAE9559680.1 short-chain dehydrogenase [Companilactobacillus kimchii]KRK52988.1 short chain dehydrogenase [Companilactobacillus kimchii DSM 13961 = JCM 10707]OWF32124.1 3-oxoacyl-[acyl-carrier-protein] reductase [Companilactobacillus kimchii]GEO47929.1 short-chain dehydrogenase/reductase [Companilactobacillus paralimentarius]